MHLGLNGDKRQDYETREMFQALGLVSAGNRCAVVIVIELHLEDKLSLLRVLLVSLVKKASKVFRRIPLSYYAFLGGKLPSPPRQLGEGATCTP